MDVRRFLLALTLLAAAICLVLGIVLPVIRLTKLYVWTNEHSMASIIWALYRDGEYLLSFVIMVFSIILPGLKLVYLLAAAIQSGADGKDGLIGRAAWIGRWSMLDVLVLALTVFYAKATGIADAVTLPGIWFFVASVVLTMIAHQLLPGRQAIAASRPPAA